jgi:hypothetical protein
VHRPSQHRPRCAWRNQCASPAHDSTAGRCCRPPCRVRCPVGRRVHPTHRRCHRSQVPQAAGAKAPMHCIGGPGDASASHLRGTQVDWGPPPTRHAATAGLSLAPRNPSAIRGSCRAHGEGRRNARPRREAGCETQHKKMWGDCTADKPSAHRETLCIDSAEHESPQGLAVAIISAYVHTCQSP